MARHVDPAVRIGIGIRVPMSDADRAELEAMADRLDEPPARLARRYIMAGIRRERGYDLVRKRKRMAGDGEGTIDVNKENK